MLGDLLASCCPHSDKGHMMMVVVKMEGILRNRVAEVESRATGRVAVFVVIIIVVVVVVVIADISWLNCRGLNWLGCWSQR